MKRWQAPCRGDRQPEDLACGVPASLPCRPRDAGCGRFRRLSRSGLNWPARFLMTCLLNLPSGSALRPALGLPPGAGPSCGRHSRGRTGACAEALPLPAAPCWPDARPNALPAFWLDPCSDRCNGWRSQRRQLTVVPRRQHAPSGCHGMACTARAQPSGELPCQRQAPGSPCAAARGLGKKGGCRLVRLVFVHLEQAPGFLSHAGSQRRGLQNLGVGAKAERPADALGFAAGRKAQDDRAVGLGLHLLVRADHPVLQPGRGLGGEADFGLAGPAVQEAAREFAFGSVGRIVARIRERGAGYAWTASANLRASLASTAST